jgi:hypothetical protein
VTNNRQNGEGCKEEKGGDIGEGVGNEDRGESDKKKGEAQGEGVDMIKIVE